MQENPAQTVKTRPEIAGISQCDVRRWKFSAIRDDSKTNRAVFQRPVKAGNPMIRITAVWKFGCRLPACCCPTDSIWKSSIAEKFGVGARTNKVNPVGVDLVNQQEVAADMAFTVICPFPFQAVIQPLRGKRCVIGDEQQHRLLESHHIEAPRMGQALPIFQKRLGVIGGSRQHRAFTCRCFFQGQQTVRQQRQSAHGVLP